MARRWAQTPDVLKGKRFGPPNKNYTEIERAEIGVLREIAVLLSSGTPLPDWQIATSIGYPLSTIRLALKINDRLSLNVVQHTGAAWCCTGRGIEFARGRWWPKGWES